MTESKRYFKIIGVMFILLLGVIVQNLPQAEGKIDNPLAGKPTAHSRLYLTQQGLAELKERIKTDPRFAGVWEKVKQKADKAVKVNEFQPASTNDPDKQHQHEVVLEMMRKFMDQMLPMALAYRVTGEERYLNGAVRELEWMSKLDRWGDPGAIKYDLCTGEASATVGITYDWLYNALSPEQRAMIRKAAHDKSFRVYLADCKTKKGPLFVNHNHNVVDNGGAFVLAVSLWGEDDLAGEVAGNALQNVRIFLDHLPADGGYPEGTMYWGYAFMYLGYMLGAGDAVPGFPLWDQYPVLQKSCEFPMYMTNGFGSCADFSDSELNAPGFAVLNLFARHYHEPRFAQYLEQWPQNSRDLALRLVWMLPEIPKNLPVLPSSHIYPEMGWASFRTGWGPQDLFLAVKGGANQANHSHLDLGSFALAYGGRWFTLNPHGDYSSNYFDKDGRWKYYAAGTIGQNTVVIDGENQDPQAAAKLSELNDETGHTGVVVDLTAAWKSKVQSFGRRFTLDESGGMTITDQIVASENISCDWQMHSPEEPIIHGNEAQFPIKNGYGLIIRAVQPAGVVFQWVTVPNAGKKKQAIQKLVLHQSGRNVQFVVSFIPVHTK